jgi:lipoprotein-anchoring transpeptidase ErfK/SrfK
MLHVLLVVVGIGLVAASSDYGFAQVTHDGRAAGSPFDASLSSFQNPGKAWMLLARRSTSDQDRTGANKSRPTKSRGEDADSARKSAGVSKAAPSSGAEPVRASARVQPGNEGDSGAYEQRLSSSETPFRHMEIEVSHSGHIFRLFGNLPSGQRQLLHECRVGLGGPGFPTPVGVYYVTHIYDNDPWWIPPKDRAWAAGQSPSTKVYGGTMAPLLKKRPVRFKKQAPEPEDMIAGEVQLDDYGYRFHGTNQPRSIGHNQSHGCVRMIPDDAKKVASLIKQYVGEAEQKQSENGSFVVLKAPVRLNLVK